MPVIITNHLDEIARLCRDNGIARLDLFGSGATGAFVSGRSDLDFFVDLGDYDRYVGRRYARLATGLIRLFGEDIDLLTTRGVTKPYLIAEIERTRVKLYQA